MTLSDGITAINLTDELFLDGSFLLIRTTPFWPKSARQKLIFRKI